MDGGEEGLGVFSVSGGNAAPAFEGQEGVLDAVAALIKSVVVGSLHGTVFLRRDHRTHALGYGLFEKCIGIVSCVGNQVIGVDAIGLHVNQIKKYEAGSAQPTLPVLVKLAQRLHVSLDALVFAEGERGPDERLKLQFEAIRALDPKEREALETAIAGVLHMHDARRWTRPEVAV